jgi:pimeloyl-ACP methyl ester carboxylesterase
MLKKYFLLFFSMVIVTSWVVSAYADIQSSGQPTSGPGGSDYTPYTDVKKETRGSGINKYIIYEPDPKAANPLPVIAFLHGYSMFPDPQNTLDFVKHLVKKGNIVIWPYYMILTTLPENYDRNAGNAIRAALEHIISNNDHAKPEYDSSGLMNFALMGHSAGGITAANLASTYANYGLHPPKALVALNPGRGSNLAVPIRDYRQIPGNIFMQITVGSEDEIANNHGRYIWDNSPQIPNSHKDWILVHSDPHGDPDSNNLVADHYAPLAGGSYSPNTLDWYGYWKWATALCHYAFYGIDGEFAIGDTSEQRYMGVWSDGQAVIEPEVFDYVVWP